MIKFLWCWIIGMGCKWEQVSEHMLYVSKSISSDQRPSGIAYIVRCSTCGKIKRVDLR